MIKRLQSAKRISEQKSAVHFFPYEFGIFGEQHDHYISYKTGEKDRFSQQKLKEMEVLFILEKLGFSVENVGTYLFKNTIIHIIKNLEINKNSEELLDDLRKPFSQFYMEVSRHDLDMGLKSFHAHIEDTINNIDCNKVDWGLFSDVMKDLPTSPDYGEYALSISKYLLEKSKQNSNLDLKYIKVLKSEN